MKTVMKKMFSLLLVAVMLVGIMPFQAFADTEGTVTAVLKIGSAETTMTETRAAGWETSINDIITVWFQEDSSRFSHAAFLDSNGNVASTTSDLNSTVTVGNVVHIRLHEAAVPEHTHDWADATCTTPKTCKDSACGETEGEPLGHTWVIDAKVDPTCTTDGKTEGKHCDVCGVTDPAQEVILATGHTAGAAATCTTAQTCTVCGETLAAALGHSVDDATNKCTRCGKDFAQATPAVPTGTAALNVWANLYVGDKKVDTILLDTITGLSSDAKIYQVISDNRARLVNKFPAGYSNDSWSNNVYFMVDADTANLVTSRMTVGGEDDAIINLYANQKLVVVRVHLGKTYAVDHAVQINGFRVGDTVTYNDVKKAVQKHYNVSSMKIYTYGEWEKVVNGKDANNITNFVVQGGDNDNIYEVYLSGSHKTSSSSATYTADSTNPKTGDTIFAPIAIMGLSVSALAVLFFLNKKRAY